MPVMPINERTAIKIFIASRTAYSVVVVNVEFRCGCLIWTAMNSSPPTTADMPAARVSLVVVMVMSLPAGLVRGGCRGNNGNVGRDVVTGRHHMMWMTM